MEESKLRLTQAPSLQKRSGFTLIELLVVIAIIGLLSTIAFISLNRARVKARDAKRVADVRQLQSALELYYSDQNPNGYPWDQFDAPLSDRGKKINSAILPSSYVATVPVSPQPPDSSFCSTTSTHAQAGTTQRNEYIYVSRLSNDSDDCKATSGPCGWYHLYFCLGADGAEHVASPSGIQ